MKNKHTKVLAAVDAAVQNSKLIAKMQQQVNNINSTIAYLQREQVRLNAIAEKLTNS